MQHSAAGMVINVDRHDHISPMLQQLHWFPVEQYIKYKILLRIYGFLTGLDPAYISELLRECVPSRTLQSNSESLLVVPWTRTAWGDRSF